MTILHCSPTCMYVCMYVVFWLIAWNSSHCQSSGKHPTHPPTHQPTIHGSVCLSGNVKTSLDLCSVVVGHHRTAHNFPSSNGRYFKICNARFLNTQVFFLNLNLNLLIIAAGYPPLGIIWNKLEIKILWVFMHNKSPWPQAALPSTIHTVRNREDTTHIFVVQRNNSYP
jgi:hypothetical protein